MKLVLNPPQKSIDVYGSLAFVTKKERARILALPAGKFKPAVRQIEKEIRNFKKLPESLRDRILEAEGSEDEYSDWSET